jgi:methionyl aminopeptidase
MNTEKIIKAGSIVSKVREYAKTIVKPGVPLLEIAEKIEAQIAELGGKPAFPTNLSINEIAAHYTPSHDDTTKAHGLLKVDFGVHVDGFTADNAFSVDLEDSEENKILIKASEEALNKAIGLIKEKIGINNKEKVVNNKNDVSSSVKESLKGGGGVDGGQISVNEIGFAIQETIESHGCNPVINLCGHSMKQYELHGGVSIPNIDDGRKITLVPGLYAIEPFVTNGSGKVRDGRPSEIYEMVSEKSPRGSLAREVLELIKKEYNTLPFCSRWIVKILGSKALFGLRELEANGNLHHFAQLVEISGSNVAQTEHTILVEKDKVIVTTM